MLRYYTVPALHSHLRRRHGMLGEYAAREGGTRIMHALKHSQLLRRKLQGALWLCLCRIAVGECIVLHMRGGACCRWLAQASAPVAAAAGAQHNALALFTLPCRVFGG